MKHSGWARVGILAHSQGREVLSWNRKVFTLWFHSLFPEISRGGVHSDLSRTYGRKAGFLHTHCGLVSSILAASKVEDLWPCPEQAEFFPSQNSWACSGRKSWPGGVGEILEKQEAQQGEIQPFT